MRDPNPSKFLVALTRRLREGCPVSIRRPNHAFPTPAMVAALYDVELVPIKVRRPESVLVDETRVLYQPSADRRLEGLRTWIGISAVLLGRERGLHQEEEAWVLAGHLAAPVDALIGCTSWLALADRQPTLPDWFLRAWYRGVLG